MHIFYSIIAMAGLTYLLRSIPFILIRRLIENAFLKSFLAYIPYTILASMTIPAIFYATKNKWIALAALLVAVFFALLNKGLIVVAFATCLTVFLLNWI